MGTKRVGMARVKSLINENLNQLKIFKQEQITLVHNVTTNHTITEAQSGATIFWEHGSEHNITLPDATAGLHYKFILTAASNHAQHIVSQTSDVFYGKVVVVRAAGGADDKNSTQTVAKGAGLDQIKLRDRGATLGGNIGDVIDIWCFEDGYWTVDARLSLTNGNPSGTAVLAD